VKLRRNGLCVLASTLLALAALSAARANAQQQLSPAQQAAIGHWQVINDEGKPNGRLETYLIDGKLYGKVTQLRPGSTPGTLCVKCPGDLKNQPVLGMVVLRNFQPQDDIWAGGTIVDPDNGKEYKGKIWTVGNNKLHLRGFVGFSLLGRTQTWIRLP
jgi:uncharacterized protein (DUF2147 family)